MRQEHHKLVRDKIPDLILQSGSQCEWSVLSHHEYLQALRDKLVEEAQEAADASPEAIVAELADLYEVIDGILAVLNLNRATVLAEQKRKREARGGFEQKIRLDWTDR